MRRSSLCLTPSGPPRPRPGWAVGLLAAGQVEGTRHRHFPVWCRLALGSWSLLPQPLPIERHCLGLEHLGVKELSGGNVSLPGSHATSWPWGRWTQGPDLLPSYSQAACSPASPVVCCLSRRKAAGTGLSSSITMPCHNTHMYSLSPTAPMSPGLGAGCVRTEGV